MNLKLISFPAGGSGHFLADFLTINSNLRDPSFRIDNSTTKNPTQAFLSSGISEQNRNLVEFDESEKLKTNLQTIIDANVSTVLTHFSKLSFLSDSLPEGTWVKKIYPLTNIFGLIKNTYFKKSEAEKTSYQFVDELAFKIDMAFTKINESYAILKTDTEISENIIDFGKLYDIEFLKELYYSVNGFYPDDVTINWAEKYIDMQFNPIDDMSDTDFTKICNSVNPKDYFDVAVCLFIYEKNNNTIDVNRLWSIDDIPNTVNDALVFLTNNSKNYRIFK